MSEVFSTQDFIGLQFGYIVVPMKVDRTLFIEQCYRWERVSILVERGGGVIHDCYITRQAMGEIEFPTESKKLGSCVSFITNPFSGLPIILGVLSKEDESQLLTEGSFKFSKTYQGSSVTIVGDAKNGVLNLAVSGGSVSQLNISVSNSTNNASINIRCKGSVNVEVEDKFKINSGSEPMVLGTELKTQLDNTNTYLDDLQTAIKNALISVDALIPGTSAAFIAAMLNKNPGDYSEINSEESFLD